MRCSRAPALCAAGGITLLIATTTRADILFQTDFEDYALDSVNGQFGWTVGGDGTDGTIISADGSRVLRVGTRFDWGEEVRRPFDAPSRRYLSIEMDFRLDEIEHTFWFMDANRTGGNAGPDSLFWYSLGIATNASPGIPPMAMNLGSWYHAGLEIDQQGRKVIGVNYDGVWVPEIDDVLSDPEFLDFVVFRGVNDDPGETYGLLIDNLLVRDGDAPLTPAPGAPAAMIAAALFWRRSRRASCTRDGTSERLRDAASENPRQCQKRLDLKGAEN